MLKRIFVLMLLFTFTAGFTTGDIINKYDTNPVKSECPFVNKLIQKSDNNCPFLENKVKCPVLKENNNQSESKNYKLVKTISS